MVFASFIFIFFFLPACLAVYYLLPDIRSKNRALLIFSFIFYAWGEPIWILQMLLSGTLVWFSGLKLELWLNRRSRSQNRRAAAQAEKKAKQVLYLGLTLALIPLLIFKYLSFVLENLGLLFGAAWTIPGLSLPIGISFYTFQLITYLVDLYRNETEVQRSLADFLLYESFFPQLIAGPIVRYRDIAAQINYRKHSVETFLFGFQRFLIGLSKKVLIANYAGKLVAASLDLEQVASLSGLEILLGTIAFAIQIYFDFSAYSDMAIGLAQIFGFRLRENFTAPYRSASVTEFWRRWHISLGSFFRDYVYIPLGGNRRHQFLNLSIVWFLTGLWHGASWNFILWGLYYLCFLLLEKSFLLRALDRLPRFVGRIYMIPVTLGGWLLFKFTDLKLLGQVLKQVFSGPFLSLSGTLLFRKYALFLLIAVLLSQISWPEIQAFLARRKARSKLQYLASTDYILSFIVLPLLLLVLSLAALAADSFNPFLYFRF
ncbi:MAG: MBOAT family O-acyltransferase [Eubacteriales bacterium]|nr:MBOAT family O-acyltransferase [Eubacteriales bacterium]